jgi:flagellar biosynthetic protein FliR
MRIGEPEIAAFLAVLLRTAAWIHAAPIVGDKGLPPRLRLALAALVALPLSIHHPATDFAHLLTAAPAELLFGLSAGFALRLAFAGVEAGGQLIGIQLELNFAATFDPTSGDESLPTRRLAWCVAGLAFLSMGGLEHALAALAVPAPPLLERLPELFERGGLVFVLALRAAGPMLVAAFVANLAVGLASRAAPALNIFSVMLAALLVVGALVLLGTSSRFAAEIIGDMRLGMDAAIASTR